MESADKHRLPVPQFQVFDNMFRVNLYRNQLLDIAKNYVSKSEEDWKYIRGAPEIYCRNTREIPEKHRRNIKDIFEEI